MVTAANKNRFGYIFLTIGVVAGLLGAFRNDSSIRKVNEKQTTFIVRQCDREKIRNEIAIRFLERDRFRVSESKEIDPGIKSSYLTTIDTQIHELRNVPPCRLP